MFNLPKDALLMNLRNFALGAITALSSISVPAYSFAACDARSGPKTAALVELYTSEGCSSCPPADRQLSRLRQTLDAAATVVPLALHVGYWDYIGWKDPYAQTAFGQRQSWLVQANRHRTVYTPQFFISGSELRTGQGSLREKVREINARPAAAAIRVHASITPNGALQLDAEATARARPEPVALYLVITESGLVSKVARGENSGVTLAHDNVVREWIGPVRLNDGVARERREIALPAGWNRARLAVVAFVQDLRTGKVLQAVAAQQCTGS